ncbi:MAG TPA: ATP-dependent DNA helicase RecG [Candidatus Saccharimonadales bacterium]|nr:ATP-dependent DNA helicase RecG [Candidatus Saccharimonadales bacterium]
MPVTRRAAVAPPVLSPAELLDARLDRSNLPGAAAMRAAARRLGIETVRDLLFHLPRRYEDLRELRRLGELAGIEDGTVVSARVEVRDLRVEPTFRRRIQRTIAYLGDATGEAEATWFGRRFIDRRLRRGDWLVISGRLKRRGWTITFDNPEFQKDDGAALLHAGRIVPIYRLTAGLTVARLRSQIRVAIDRAGSAYPEYLPPALLAEEQLVGIGSAIETAHYPESFEARDAALRRLAFDELLALQLGMVERRRERTRASATPILVDDASDATVRAAITGSLGRRLGREARLTDDQAAAIAAIRADLARREPMLRLLQGDVGSGKTAVAAWALAQAARTGLQGALLAPTDLLARQHAATLSDLLDDVGLQVTLLTGSLSAPGTNAAREAIANGQAGVIVGTHALIQESVSFARLGLVVIDEQHRFGVDQRAQLESKGPGNPPHVLLMTATPIPRTIGQVVYADLDVVDLRTPPSGRIPVVTGIRRPDDLAGTWRRVRTEAAAGHRTFVVVPLVEEADEDSAAAAEAETERLRTELNEPSTLRAAGLDREIRVGMVHGRMRSADRDAEMTRFRDGQLDVLVGTTVIEVGVDVPEATMMIVLDADRFGLAQLHQLRGRVGRREAESFCVLVSGSTDETAGARLEAVRTTRDGFALAEKDFELRREGDVLGLTQSGLPQLRVASLQRPEDRALAGRARHHAEAMLDVDGSLGPTAPTGLARAGLAHELHHGWLARVAAGDPAGGA